MAQAVTFRAFGAENAEFLHTLGKRPDQRRGKFVFANKSFSNDHPVSTAPGPLMVLISAQNSASYLFSGATGCHMNHASFRFTIESLWVIPGVRRAGEIEVA